MSTTLVLAQNPWFQAAGMAIAAFSFPMLVSVALAFKEFRPGKRKWVVICGLCVSLFSAYAFSSVQTELVLDGSEVSVRYLNGGKTSLNAAEVRSIEVSPIRGGGEVMVLTLQGKRREVISVDATRLDTTAQQLALFLGLKPADGSRRWERP